MDRDDETPLLECEIMQINKNNEYQHNPTKHAINKHQQDQRASTNILKNNENQQQSTTVKDNIKSITSTMTYLYVRSRRSTTINNIYKHQRKLYNNQ